MKPKALSLCLCGLFLLAGCGQEAEQARQQLEKELETARAELATATTERANLQNEVARMRKDNEDLLRLRNEVRQLRDKEKQLTQQAQSAQTELQRAQAQSQAAQAQAQAAQAQAAQAQALGTDRLQAIHTQALQVNACINHLRQIDAAKQQWALENRKTADTVPTAQDIAAYLKDGVPKCPAGGNYMLNAVGAHPACSLPGHALAQ